MGFLSAFSLNPEHRVGIVNAGGGAAATREWHGEQISRCVNRFTRRGDETDTERSESPPSLIKSLPKGPFPSDPIAAAESQGPDAAF